MLVRRRVILLVMVINSVLKTAFAEPNTRILPGLHLGCIVDEEHCAAMIAGDNLFGVPANVTIAFSRLGYKRFPSAGRTFPNIAVFNPLVLKTFLRLLKKYTTKLVNL